MSKQFRLKRQIGTLEKGMVAYCEPSNLDYFYKFDDGNNRLSFYLSNCQALINQQIIEEIPVPKYTDEEMETLQFKLINLQTNYDNLDFRINSIKEFFKKLQCK